MKTLLAIFTGSRSDMEAWHAMDAAQREAREKAGMAAWEAWAENNRSSIVDQGAPVGKTKRITAEGISDIRNNIAAYSVVRAESHEAAASMFEQYPLHDLPRRRGGGHGVPAHTGHVVRRAHRPRGRAASRFVLWHDHGRGNPNPPGTLFAADASSRPRPRAPRCGRRAAAPSPSHDPPLL